MALLRISICLALVWAVLTRSARAAAEPENAATYYRKAFALVPHAPPDLEVYKAWTTVPLDERALAAFQRCQQARQLLNQASQLHTCDWEWDYDQGLKLQLPELRSARPLVSAAPFWARVLFEQKHAADGVDVVHDLLVLSRRFGVERMVVARLMARPVETSAWMAASPFLPEMPAEQRNRLADIVARLPALLR